MSNGVDGLYGSYPMLKEVTFKWLCLNRAISTRSMRFQRIHPWDHLTPFSGRAVWSQFLV